jgi:hypothetical protein
MGRKEIKKDAHVDPDLLVLDDIEQFAHAESDGATDKRSGSRQNPVLRTILRLGTPIEASSVSYFRIRKVCEGNRHALIVVNGFLSKHSKQINDWQHGLSRRYHFSTIHHVDWKATGCPSSALHDLVTLPEARSLLSKTAQPIFGISFPRGTARWLKPREQATSLPCDKFHAGLEFHICRPLPRSARGVLRAQRPRHAASIMYRGRLPSGGAVGGPKDDGCWGTATRVVKAPSLGTA